MKVFDLSLGGGVFFLTRMKGREDMETKIFRSEGCLSSESDRRQEGTASVCVCVCVLVLMPMCAWCGELGLIDSNNVTASIHGEHTE